MKTYPKYKESGIPWMGQIPEGWSVIKTKHIANLYTGNSLNDTQKEQYSLKAVSSIPHLPYVATKDVSADSEDIDYENGLAIPLGESGFKVAPKNSFLLCIEGGSAGKKRAYLSRDVYFVNKLCCFATTLNSRYHYFYIQSTPFLNRFQQLMQGLIGGVSVSDLNEMEVPVPSLAEQQAIAEYLDKKTGDIDELVGLLNKQIADVRAYRQSLITETVTQRLNKNVPMKDSGIKWIGQIPEGWEVMKLPYILDNLDYLRKPIASEKRSRNNPRYNYYGASGVIDKIDEYNVEDKVLLIGEDGANLVMRNLPLVYKAEGKFWVNNHAHILKPKANANYDYFYYFLELVDYTPYITGSAQPKLSQDNLNKVLCVLPSLSEQESIAHFLNAKTMDIDELLSKLEAQVADLLAYKSSLISEVVTGKIDIR